MSAVASPSRPPPPLRPPPGPATHALAAARPPPRLGLISILTETVAGGRRCGGRPGLRGGGGRQGRTRRGGGVGARAEPPAARGSVSFFLSFLFSLCLLQDLKGQPRPRRGTRRPPFLRSPDALCGRAGPARTRSEAPDRWVFLGPHPARGSGVAELGSGARLFLQRPIRGGNKTTQQLLSHPKAGSKE